MQRLADLIEELQDLYEGLSNLKDTVDAYDGLIDSGFVVEEMNDILGDNNE